MSIGQPSLSGAKRWDENIPVPYTCKTKQDNKLYVSFVLKAFVVGRVS